MRSVKNKPMSALLNYGGKQKKGRQRCRKIKVWSGTSHFCRFLTTTTSCLKTAENKPSTILWGLCWKTAEISAVFQQLVFGRFPTTQNVSAVFQQRGFGRFPTIFSAVFHIPIFYCWLFQLFSCCNTCFSKLVIQQVMLQKIKGNFSQQIF